MYNIQTWNFETSSTVRSIMIDNEPWFLGKDICDVFGDTNSNRSIARLDEEDRQFIDITDRLGRPQKAVFITEGGIYNLLLIMQPQKARNNGEIHENGEYSERVQARIDLIFYVNI